MELKQMEYFKTVVEAGSISAAARMLNMSQPPLSMSIKNLETELGADLLIRGNRYVRLTEAGALFYQRVCRILELSDNTTKEIKRAGKIKTLSLGLTPSTIPIASPLLADYSRKNPDTHFQIYDGSTFELQHLLDNQVINAAFLRTPFPVGNYESVFIRKEPMVACIPKALITEADPISQGKPIKLQLLQKYPLSSYRRYQELLNSVFSKNGLTPSFYSICDDARTSLMWVNCGLAVAVFPKSLSPEIKNSVICPIKCAELETSILFVYKKSNNDSILSDFIGLLE